MGIVDAFESAAYQKTKDARIFCDCDGTLFQTKKNGPFNVNLFKFLIELKKGGHDVAIFSAETGANEGRVKLYSAKYTGNPDFFENDGFVVTPKEMVSGQKAFLVIDDNHSTHGVQATHKWDPDSDSLIAELAEVVKSPKALRDVVPPCSQRP